MYYFNLLGLVFLGWGIGAFVDSLIGVPAGPIHIVTTLPVTFAVWYLWLKFFDEKPRQEDVTSAPVSFKDSALGIKESQNGTYLESFRKCTNAILAKHETGGGRNSVSKQVTISDLVSDENDLRLAHKVALNLELTPEQFAYSYLMILSTAKLREVQRATSIIPNERVHSLRRIYALISADCASKIKTYSSQFGTFEDRLLALRKKR